MSNQEYQYTIDDIASICKVTKQSIYNLIKANKEFINENSRRYQRRLMYNQAALQYFTEYYQVEAPEVDTIKAPDKQETKNTEALEGKIKTLQAEFDTLKQLLAETEAERKALIHQNGALILTLQQEKQEKMLLLPAPKKTIGERIKGLFHKEE